MLSTLRDTVLEWFTYHSPLYIAYLFVLALMILTYPSSFVYIACTIIVDLFVSGVFIALTLFAIKKRSTNTVGVSIVYLIPYFLLVFFFYLMAFVGGEKLLSQSTYIRLFIGVGFLIVYESKKLFSSWKQITGREYEQLVSLSLFKPLFLAMLILLLAYFVYPVLAFVSLDENIILRNVLGVLLIITYKIFSEHK